MVPPDRSVVKTISQNKEIALILRKLNNNITKQGEKIDNLSHRVDYLYDNYDSYQNDENYEPYEEVNLDEEWFSHSFESDENEHPQKTDSLFKDWSEKLQAT